MTDTITESFCERCGTRYSFEQAAPRRRAGIGRVRVLTRGLKTYVANDGMPMNEAMAVAQSDEERAAVSRQLDAFHQAFNFCMSCRQYTCASCWNGKVGECLSCAPDLAREVLPPLFPDLPLDGPAGMATEASNGEAAGAAAWPTADLARLQAGPAAPDAPDVPDGPAATGIPEDANVLARLDAFVGSPPAGEVEELTPIELAEIETALAAAHPAAGAPVAGQREAAEEPAAVGPEPAEEHPLERGAEAPGAAAEPVTETARDAAVDAQPVDGPPAAAVEAEPAGPQPPEPPPVETAGRATAAQRQTRSLLGRFRPSRAPGAVVVASAAAAQAEPSTEAAAHVEPPAETGFVMPPATDRLEPALAAELPIEHAAAPAASAALGAEPTAAAEPTPAIEPQLAASEAEPAPDSPVVPPAAPIDAVEQPTWRIVAPDAAPPAPAWPDAPAWPAPGTDGAPAAQVPGPAAAPWAARLATARPEPANIWAASSQEVLAAPGPAVGRPGAPAIQACVSCGLSLSANARFCRRCGSRQG